MALRLLGDTCLYTFTTCTRLGSPETHTNQGIPVSPILYQLLFLRVKLHILPESKRSLRKGAQEVTISVGGTVSFTKFQSYYRQNDLELKQTEAGKFGLCRAGLHFLLEPEWCRMVH